MAWLFVAVLLTIGLVPTSEGCFEIPNPNPQFGGAFGYTVASSNDLLAVASPYADQQRGVVYVYHCTKNSCKMGSEFHGPNDDARFGITLSFQGDLLIVGASRGENGQGVKVGQFTGYQCSPTAVCTPHANNPYMHPTINYPLARFGAFLALQSDGLLAVSAYNDTETGGVYFYQCSSTNCNLLSSTPLIVPNPKYFGTGIALSNNVLFTTNTQANEVVDYYAYDCDSTGNCVQKAGPLSSNFLNFIYNPSQYVLSCGGINYISDPFNQGTGSVQVLDCSGSGCFFNPEVFTSPQNVTGDFGAWISCKGNSVAISSDYENNFRGVTYLYDVDPVTHTLGYVRKYEVADADIGDNVGFTNDLGNFVTLVGIRDDDGIGQVYVMDPSEPTCSKYGASTAQITVATMPNEKAGTRGRVYITIYGTIGQKTFILSRSGIAKGAKTFSVSGLKVGSIHSVAIKTYSRDELQIQAVQVVHGSRQIKSTTAATTKSAVAAVFALY